MTRSYTFTFASLAAIALTFGLWHHYSYLLDESSDTPAKVEVVDPNVILYTYHCEFRGMKFDGKMKVKKGHENEIPSSLMVKADGKVYELQVQEIKMIAETKKVRAHRQAIGLLVQKKSASKKDKKEQGQTVGSFAFVEDTTDQQKVLNQLSLTGKITQNDGQKDRIKFILTPPASLVATEP